MAGRAGGGGDSSDYYDDSVERGTEILGCDFGCLAKDIRTKLGTCTIHGENAACSSRINAAGERAPRRR
jgi:hypothetical protein